MAHNIETIAYAYKNGANGKAYQTPWHELGTPVPADLSPQQILVKAGLDWTVDRYPQYIDVDGKRISTERDVLVRSSDKRILTHVSEDWEPVQNEEAFEFFTEFVAAGDMEMNTAGSLHNGNIVWALAKVNDSFSLFGGEDEVDSYLLFTNPHVYGKCIDIRFTAIRVVCNNTLTLALNTSTKSDLFVRLNHRRKFDGEMVKKTLGIAKSKMDSYKEMAKFLASKKYDVDSLVEYYKQVFPSMSAKNGASSKISRPAQLALDNVDVQLGAELGKGTWWSAYNSVTYTIDHVVGRSADTRLQSAWYGPNRARKVNALNIATKFADAA